MKTIGFIGVGVMGKPMVRNLMKRGYPVSIYSRTKAKVLDVIEEGAMWCDSVAACAAEKDVIITMVGFPKDVEEVYFGEDGILANAKPGAVAIDMTTTSPKLSERIYTEAKKRGIAALDAPVSGGDSGAIAGTLSIMVGGDREAFDRCQDIFEALGSSITYEGGAGKGQHTKMANQIALSGIVASVAEAIAYARRTGLDVDTMLASISKGAAGSWQMDHNAPKMVSGDMAPGFYIRHFIKDMSIAANEAEDVGLTLPVLDRVLAMYKELEGCGEGSLGTQAIIHYFDKQ